MTWIFLSLFAALGYSICAFIDNYQTDVVFSKKIPQSQKIVNGISYIILAIAIFIFARPAAIENWQIGLLILSGAIASLSSIPYYLGLKNEEATGAAIYYQLIPLIYLLVGWLVFREPIELRQIIGFIVVIIAPILIIFSRKRPRSRRKEFVSALFFILYAITAAASGLLSTKIGENIPFSTVFFYFLLGRGVSDLALYACHKSWQQRMKFIWRRKRKIFLPAIITNQLITAAAEAANRYALILGVAALSSVITNAAELILTFILGIVLSIIWPKFGREKLTRHVVIAHLLAVILCVIGIIILQ